MRAAWDLPTFLGGRCGAGDDCYQKLDEAVRSQAFWATLRLMHLLQQLLTDMEVLLSSCPCHSHRRMSCSCPIQGRWAPHLAAGTFSEIARDASTGLAALLVATRGLDDKMAGMILADWDCGRSKIEYQLAVKFGSWQHLPLRLAALGHSDPTIVREAAAACLAEFDSYTDHALRHRLSKLVRGP